QAARKSAPTLLFAKRLIASHGSILPFAKAYIIYMARPGQMTFASSTERQDNNSSDTATLPYDDIVPDTATLPYDDTVPDTATLPYDDTVPDTATVPYDDHNDDYNNDGYYYNHNHNDNVIYVSAVPNDYTVPYLISYASE
ncbi:hypothetical protein FOZ61_001119, partial [Perkinsus olseni]